MCNKRCIPQERYKSLSCVKRQKGKWLLTKHSQNCFQTKKNWFGSQLQWSDSRKLQNLNPQRTQQKSSWLTCTFPELFIFCTCLSRHQFYSIQVHCLSRPSSVKPHWISTSLHGHFSSGSCFWMHKETCLYFLKQQQRLGVTLEGLKSGSLPCYLITPFHVEVHRVGKPYLPEQPNPHGYELLSNNHRALDIFFWCTLLSVFSFQSRVQCTAQI